MNSIGCLYMLSMPSGRSYIGITTRPLAKRVAQHGWLTKNTGRGFAIHHALRKYGRDKAVVRKVLIGRWDYLKAIEPLAIKAFGTKFPYGYNLTDRGDGVLGLTPQARERIAASGRGRKCPEHVRAAVSAAQRGRAHSAEHRFMAGSGFRGKKRSVDEIARRVATRRARRNGDYN